jgi:hypothetical protein
MLRFEDFRRRQHRVRQPQAIDSSANPDLKLIPELLVLRCNEQIAVRMIPNSGALVATYLMMDLGSVELNLVYQNLIGNAVIGPQLKYTVEDMFCFILAD